ncbi:predicted protein, partial [Nematostella vectensis]
PTKISCATPRQDAEKVCVVVIPGNPGSIEFYDIFIATLFSESGGKIPIYGVGHAGHTKLEESSVFKCGRPKQYEQEFPTDMHLDDQITHKLSFIAYHIPKDCKVILVGHSIGAYIVLQMMKRYHDKDKFIKGILLFPTIEHVMDSPSGRLWWVLCFYLQWPFLFLTLCFSLMPSVFQKWSISWWMYFNKFSCHDSTVSATQGFLNYRAMENMLRIGRDLGTIKEIDASSVQENLDKLVFYYGSRDPWVPRTCHEELSRKFPDANVIVCDDNIQHAFVLDASEEVAKKVWGWMEGDLVMV